MARVHYRKAAKDHGTCGRCSAEIVAGTHYFTWKPFRSRTQVRCEDHRPRPSEYATNSDKISRLYAAQESIEDALSGWADNDEDASPISEALTAAAETAREVQDEYQEALDAWEHGNEALQEKVDACEAWVDELEGAVNDIDSMEPDAEPCTECDGQGQIHEEDMELPEDCEECSGSGEVPALESFHEEVSGKAEDVSGALEI